MAGSDMDSTPTETLRDISAVCVLWDDISDGPNVLDLSKETIQTDIELKLRLAGLRVVTEEEAAQVLGYPRLHVLTFVGSIADVGPVADVALVEVRLMQQVWLDRNARPTYCATWQKNNVSLRVHAQFVRDQIKDLVDRFLNDWLSVNPKK
jgi:hypothetical protein